MRPSIFFALLALLTCACIKPPDDGMSLGDPTTAESIDQVKVEAQSGVPEAQAFHVGDSGVIESTETIYSATSLKESDVYKLTSMDSDYFYFDDYKVKADTTTKYKMARSHDNPSPTSTSTPTPTPSPTPAASPASAKQFWSLQKLFQIVKNLKDRISIQASTALGESILPQRAIKMDEIDLKIQKDIFNRIEEQNPTDDDGDSGGTAQYFGLKHYKHSYVTSNCSQIKNCKVTATHIEYNVISTTNGKSTQIHWAYEISKEVPGLFVIMSRCGSAITMVNNSQVPFMECSSLDTFHFGAGQTPPQE